MTPTDPMHPVIFWSHKPNLSMRNRRHPTIACVVLLLITAPSHSEGPTNRDAAIQFFVDSVGTECTQEDVDRLGLSKEQCDQRHRESVEQCKEVAVTDLPSLLSQVELGRAMLRFSLCRGMVIQGQQFDLVAWEPTITEMLEKAHENE